MEESKEKKREILIVDDEPDFALALQKALKGERCEVVVATTKEEAQKAVKTINPELVILGTLSPRGEAFLLHQWLREDPKTKDLPIVVIDAPPEKQLIKGWRRDEAALMDAEDYLTKPIEPGALASRTQMILDRATRRIRVLIVDDHWVVRDGLKSVLELQSDIEVIGQSENGKDALQKVGELGPDIVVMDIVMPEMDGLEATKQIYKKYPQTRVVMLSQYDDEANILAAEQIGAYGFIPKRAASSQVVNAIRAIHYVGKRLQKPSPISS
ncbi:MAG TPA: response regulator [Dehalococcoidia bacterium]|nr:response regulator [Dehalococcoidia bacterium]